MDQTWQRAMIGRGTPADAILVERARAGEREAFDAIVRCRVDRTFRTALAILGDEADAADATQETFVSAWRRIRDLRDADAFDPWLARIALNACRQQLRRRGRVRVREVRLDANAADERQRLGLPGGRSMDETAAETEAFDRAFGRLSIDERALLVLHHLDERPVVEIAAALGVAQGTVKSRLFRARAALESELEKESRP